ncbi:Os05g0112125 [Oryza sativa Japonica Group]|uniref:Os05g0112125 protein n=1 Tax=Oryza sativa subsp. japonica TaxID=39947 RepID=A0A0P0WH52_ORYSJ|nr:hypothetical protein EE612_026636 [Oryza sativa]BAS91936.1 Os05g0112125 [Oryza sativa Japonica Group]
MLRRRERLDAVHVELVALGSLLLLLLPWRRRAVTRPAALSHELLERLEELVVDALDVGEVGRAGEADVVAPAVEGEEVVGLLGGADVCLEDLDAVGVVHVEEAVKEDGEHDGDVGAELRALLDHRVERGEHDAALPRAAGWAAREDAVEQLAELQRPAQERLGVHLLHRRRRRPPRRRSRLVGEAHGARRGEEGYEEAGAVVEVERVGADEGGVVPRRGVRFVAELGEEREHRLAAAARGADELVAEVRVAVGDEAVGEREALGGDDVVARPGEAAREGGGAGGGVGAGVRGEGDHLADMAVLRGGVLVRRRADDGDVKLRRDGGGDLGDADGGLVLDGAQRLADRHGAGDGAASRAMGSGNGELATRCSSGS